MPLASLLRSLSERGALLLAGALLLGVGCTTPAIAASPHALLRDLSSASASSDSGAADSDGVVDPCALSSLELAGLSFRDSAGQPFTPSSLFYASSVPPSITSTALTARADSSPHADDLTLELHFRSAAGGQLTRQYMELGHPSAPLPLSVGANQLKLSVSLSGVCERTYTVECNQAPAGGFAVGDPQFVGLRGQQFQVHGASGEVYNIISDPHLQLNARFVFLANGNCPILHGRRAHGCWSHPGSYLGEIGVKTANGDRIHIVAGHAHEGFERVTINDRPVPVGALVELPCPEDDAVGRLSLNSTHKLLLAVSNFEIELDNSDLFLNQRVRVRDWSDLRAHGLLGQTWRRVTYPRAGQAPSPIEGTSEDYLVRGKDLFADSFRFNQFRDLTADE